MSQANRHINIGAQGPKTVLLRTREIIRAIRIEHGAVMLDLEEEVIDHARARSMRPARSRPRMMK